MPTNFSSGKHSIAECDRCGQRYKLGQLKKLTIKTKMVSIKVCPECWEQDQPQLQLGMYPVNDPQAVREPRPDISYYASGVDDEGFPGGGSRVFEWGWYPVGGSSGFDRVLTPNALVAVGTVNSVTIT
jgi:NAD-dependent SIR2 family protein deacetylase